MQASLTTSIAARRGVTLRVQAKAPRAMRAQRLVVMADKAEVLADVREIIAEQLGTDLDTVAPESKFVDLGADSLTLSKS
eukprot:jgi/Picre1/27299/NNA_000268.t1